MPTRKTDKTIRTQTSLERTIRTNAETIDRLSERNNELNNQAGGHIPEVVAYKREVNDQRDSIETQAKTIAKQREDQREMLVRLSTDQRRIAELEGYIRAGLDAKPRVTTVHSEERKQAPDCDVLDQPAQYGYDTGETLQRQRGNRDEPPAAPWWNR